MFCGGYVVLQSGKAKILGLYGLVGAGRSELFECLCGYASNASGKVFIHGREVKSKQIGDRIEDGIILVPENRQVDGLVQTMSVSGNIVLSSLQKFMDGICLSAKEEKKAVAEKVREISIKVPDTNNLITSLSGGISKSCCFRHCSRIQRSAVG